MKTRIKQALIPIFLVLTASACAEADNPFASVCESRDLSMEVCDCFASGATEFSDEAQAWLVAAMNEQTELAVRLKDDVPVVEMMGAGMYIVSGMQRCSEETLSPE